MEKPKIPDGYKYLKYCKYSCAVLYKPIDEMVKIFDGYWDKFDHLDYNDLLLAAVITEDMKKVDYVIYFSKPRNDHLGFTRIGEILKVCKNEEIFNYLYKDAEKCLNATWNGRPCFINYGTNKNILDGIKFSG